VRRTILSLACLLAFFLGGTLFAQQVDAEFGINSVSSVSTNNNGNVSLQSIGGGVYPSVAADFPFFHGLGVGGEVTWKGSQGLYGGFQPYRPILYDINAVYARKAGPVGFAVMGGIGSQSTRFYQPYVQCGAFTGCTNYTSSNHFLGHIGAELRFYVFGPVFVAPEGHMYFVHNNFEFSSGNVARYGVNLGVTFGK
jgi:hypothetical protein